MASFLEIALIAGDQGDCVTRLYQNSAVADGDADRQRL